MTGQKDVLIVAGCDGPVSKNIPFRQTFLWRCTKNMKYRFLNNIARIVMHRYREAKNTAQRDCY